MLLFSKAFIKTFIMEQKISISNKFCSFELSIIYTSNNPGKKLLCVFNLDNFKKFLEHQISIYFKRISEGSCDTKD